MTDEFKRRWDNALEEKARRAMASDEEMFDTSNTHRRIDQVYWALMIITILIGSGWIFYMFMTYRPHG